MNHFTSNNREKNNSFIKNNKEIFLDRADSALQEQPEDNLMVATSRAWYNGSYTMATKPIKYLELHYTMIQFLIMLFIQYVGRIQINNACFDKFKTDMRKNRCRNCK